MFYLLNFENHQFITCDNASVAEAKIRNLIASGRDKDSLEIVNGFSDDSRLNVDQFRAMCQEQGLVDNFYVDFLVDKKPNEQSTSVSIEAEPPSIALWGRLGIALNVTPDELSVLKSHDYRAAENLLVALVRSDRCSMNGDTYFPVEANEEYLHDMEEELAFDLFDMPLQDDSRALDSGTRATALQYKGITPQLSRDEWENVAAAMEYAVDERRYEAEQTRDPADRAAINAAANSWEKTLEVVGAALRSVTQIELENAEKYLALYFGIDYKNPDNSPAGLERFEKAMGFAYKQAINKSSDVYMLEDVVGTFRLNCNWLDSEQAEWLEAIRIVVQGYQYNMEQPHPLYMLEEICELSDGIREFQILAVSADKRALEDLLKAKVKEDMYGLIDKNGVNEHDPSHFCTNFCNGFVEYTITEAKVMSREEVERLTAVARAGQDSLDKKIQSAEAQKKEPSEPADRDEQEPIR